LAIPSKINRLQNNIVTGGKLQYAKNNKRVSKILQNQYGKRAPKAIVFVRFKEKSKRKKTTPKIGNNRIDNYNKTNRKFNNKTSNTSQSYNTNTVITMPGK